MADEMMKLIPLHDKILVRPRRRKTVIRSGLVIPETAESYARPEEGWVVAVNEGTKKSANILEASATLLKELNASALDETTKSVLKHFLQQTDIFVSGMPVVPSLFREGELVYFTKHVGMTITIEDVAYLIMSEDQIIGKVPLEKITEEERHEFERGADAGDAGEGDDGRERGEADAGEGEDGSTDVSAGRGDSEQELRVSPSETGTETAGEVRGNSDVGEKDSGGDHDERPSEPGEIAGSDKS